MRRDCIVPVICGLLLTAGECDRGPEPCLETRNGAASDEQTTRRPSGVAVVDLDEVAKQLGKDVTLAKAIRQGQDSLNQQLRDFQSTLKQKYRQKAEELEAEPAAGQGGPEARQQQLALLEGQFNLQLNQAQRTAQSELKAHQSRLVQRFREEVKPVAREVAAQRALGVVVTKNESVLLAFDDAHDITAAVVAKLRAKGSATRAEAPASVASRPVLPATQRR